MDTEQVTDIATPATTAAQLMQFATEKGAGIEVIERMAKLYEREREDQRRQEFAKAMTAAQVDMRPVSADATNPQTHSKYATYAAIDKKLRPIYTDHGFSLSFDTEVPAEGMLRVKAYVAHESGYEREYHIDMPTDGKGAKGGAVMTLTHATGAAASYGMRYLLKMIFNVAIGEDDRDGNDPQTAITADQAKKLHQLIADSGMSGSRKKAMLDWAGCDSIETMPTDKYDEACASCRKIIEEAKKKAAGMSENLPLND